MLLYLVKFTLGRHDDDYDSCTNWFRLNCTATINGGLSNFIIHSVEPYDKKKNRFERKLSDALMPFHRMIMNMKPSNF